MSRVEMTVPLMHLAQDYSPLHPPSTTRCRLCHQRRVVPGFTVRVRYRQGWEHEYRVCQACYEKALAAQETTVNPQENHQTRFSSHV